MSLIISIIGAISSLGTILKFIAAIRDTLGEIEFNNWIGEVEKTVDVWKVAKTPEQKSDVAKKLSNLINRHP